MSLFSSLNLARLALGAQQTAIQTVGQNIANANTEGYARQRVQMTPTPSDDLIFARVGTGVQIERIERIVDEHLEANLRDAGTDLSTLRERVRFFTMAEAIFNDLGGGGLSESIQNFFDALEDVANNPEDPTARAQFVEQSSTLTETFNYIDGQVRNLRQNLNDDVVSVADEVNRLTTIIAQLNVRIVEAEDGGVHLGTANDLRGSRDAALQELSKLVNIKVIENTRGSIQVVTGNDVLVYDKRARELKLDDFSDGDITYQQLRFVDDGSKFDPRAGRLAELLQHRDVTAVEFRAEIDALAQGFLTEFNRVHADGEGLVAHSFVRSATQVTNRAAPLGQAGFPFPIEDGRFTLQVINGGDGSRDSYVIEIDANGQPPETSLVDLVDAINAAVGADHPDLVASITVDGYFELESESPSVTFSFRDDDSGFLVAAGISTFFTGTNARDIRVASGIIDNPSLIATGRGGGPGDNETALAMLAVRDQGFLGTTKMTFESYYEAFVGALGVAGAEARDLAINQESIELSARNQRDALSGVSIDEESISLIKHQRAYQGAARFLNIVDGLLETLINSV